MSKYVIAKKIIYWTSGKIYNLRILLKNSQLWYALKNAANLIYKLIVQ